MEGVGSSDVPLVDLKGLSTAEHDLQEIATQIHQAFTTIGFVGVMNHNIAQEEVDEAWDKVDQFFQLPQKDKQKYSYVSEYKTLNISCYQLNCNDSN